MDIVVLLWDYCGHWSGREYCGGAKGAACGHCGRTVVVLWSVWWHCGHFDGTDYGGTVVVPVVTGNVVILATVAPLW